MSSQDYNVVKMHYAFVLLSFATLNCSLKINAIIVDEITNLYEPEEINENDFKKTVRRSVYVRKLSFFTRTKRPFTSCTHEFG